jgi:hypothetical protein
MWNLQLGIRWRNAIDFAWYPPQTWRHPILASAFRHQLHADADAEERRAPFADTPLERVHHAWNCIEAAPAIGERADSGQHNPVSARNHFRIAGDRNRLLMPAFTSGALKSLSGRMQIA